VEEVGRGGWISSGLGKRLGIEWTRRGGRVLSRLGEEVGY